MSGHRGSRTTVVLFTGDLRVHDHPALAEAAAVSERVVPPFVLDDSLLASDYARPNRVQFLLESLTDLDESLRALGDQLVVRRGDPVREAVAVARASGAQAVFTSADVSAFARRRARRLAEGCAEHGVEHRAFPGVTVVAPGAVLPSGGDHFRVFTPYWNRWRAAPLRARVPRPRRLVLPSGLAAGILPRRADLVGGATSPDLMPGGETRARLRLATWCREDITRYAERHDAPAAEGTSRLSPYLHLGCLSPLEVGSRYPTSAVGEAFLRQLCWRDDAEPRSRRATSPRVLRAARAAGERTTVNLGPRDPLESSYSVGCRERRVHVHGGRIKGGENRWQAK